MTWTIKAIKPENVEGWWPYVQPLLKPAVARSGGRATLDTLYAGLKESRYILWVAKHQDALDISAAMTTHVATYPARKILSIDFVGGSEMDGWLPAASDTFRRYARDTGLDGVEGGGRPGWVKALRALGWAPSVVVVEVDAAEQEQS